MAGYDACVVPPCSSLDGNYVTILARLNAVETQLDGLPVTGWTLLPGFNLMWTTVFLPDRPIGPQEHWVRGYKAGLAPTSVGVFVHGYNDYDGSYAYPAGMAFPAP